MDTQTIRQFAGCGSRRDFMRACRRLGIGQTTAGRRRELGLAEVMQLSLAARLHAVGLTHDDAAAIVRQVGAAAWSEVIVADGARFLAARRAAEGWAVTLLPPAQFAELWRFAPEGLVGSHLGPICRSVMMAATAAKVLA